MKDKDYGVIISKIDYSETSVILKIFTAKKGLISLLYKGAKKKKSKFNIYPLSIVEIEFINNQKSDLLFLTSISTYVNTNQNYLNPIKSSILFFLTEVLQKTIKTQEEENADVLSFIISRLKYLDLDDNPTNFHLYFLLDYSKYLGFYPRFDSHQVSNVFFDLKEGLFLYNKPNHEFFVEGVEAQVLSEFLGTEFDSNTTPNLNGIKRIRLLEIIIDYYKIQIEGFGTCKTLEVLETIFND